MPKFSGFDEAVVIDVETTGFSPEDDRIVSVAMIRASFGQLKSDPGGLETEILYRFVNPERKIPSQASAVHGIYHRHVRDEPAFSGQAEELREFIGGRPVIAHNLTFDKQFMNAEFRRAGMKSLQRNKGFCTMLRYREFNHGIWKGSKLDDAARALQLKGRRGTVHDAAEDAFMALQIARVFFLMDSGLKIPGGRPKPPGRTGNFRSGQTSRSRRF